MRPEDTRLGMKVKVAERYRKSELRGMTGTVVRIYGDDSHVAVDVLLEDGRSRLFWRHDLEESEKEPAARSGRGSSLFRLWR